MRLPVGRARAGQQLPRQPVGLLGVAALDVPLLLDERLLGLRDAVPRAPGVFRVEQHLLPRRVGRRGGPASGARSAQTVSACVIRSALARFIAVSRADDPAPSSQYGVQSPRRTGSLSP